jgi:hypothetical protein
LVALGSPDQLSLPQVKDRIVSILGEQFVTTKQVREALSDPKPSEDQILKGLEALASEGKAERNPPISKGKQQGVRYEWRRTPNLSSDQIPIRSEEKFEPKPAGWEDI